MAPGVFYNRKYRRGCRVQQYFFATVEEVVVTYLFLN